MNVLQSLTQISSLEVLNIDTRLYDDNIFLTRCLLDPSDHSHNFKDLYLENSISDRAYKQILLTGFSVRLPQFERLKIYSMRVSLAEKIKQNVVGHKTQVKSLKSRLSSRDGIEQDKIEIPLFYKYELGSCTLLEDVHSDGGFGVDIRYFEVEFFSA
jgi:hypothetical protein